MKKKIVVGVSLIMVLIGCARSASAPNSTSVTTNSSASTEVQMDAQNLSREMQDAKKGDYITIGTYEQDGVIENGKEPLEWEVLSVDSDKMLVTTRYVIDIIPFHETADKSVNWESSSLRRWLNSDFISDTFSADEQNMIQEVTLTNEGNPWTGAEGSGNTTDRVFCLSVNEMLSLFEFSDYLAEVRYGMQEESVGAYSEALIIDSTAYAKSKDAWILEIDEKTYTSKLEERGYTRSCIGQVGTMYWTRTICDTISPAICRVDFYGQVAHAYGQTIDNPRTGIRPAMYISR